MLARRFALLPVLASLGLAACGGEEAPTRQEFASQANRICVEVERATERQQTPDSPDELAGLAGSLTSTVDRATKRIQDLEVPEGADGDKAKQFQDALARETNDTVKPALSDLKQAAEARDEKRIVSAAERLQAASRQEGRSDKLAKELGANECAD